MKMVRLEVTQKVLRESIHQYLSTKADLAAVKMKDLRTSLHSNLGIPLDKLKNEDYKPLIENFAAEYILLASGKGSQQNTNILKCSEGNRDASQQNESGSNKDETTNSQKLGSDEQAKQSSSKKEKGKKIVVKIGKAEPVASKEISNADSANSAMNIHGDSDNKSMVVKQGKFSQAETELVRNAIQDYCAANRVEPTSICRYFRSQGVVKKFIKSSQESSSAISVSKPSSSVRDLLQDVEEDEDGQFSKSHQELYKLLQDLLPHRKPPSLRQCVNRILLSDYLPKSKFSPAEEQKLLELVEEVGHQFTIIGRALGRRPDDCKQALIRLKRKKSGQFSFQEDQLLTGVILEQLGLPALSALPSSGISWVGVAKNMNEERTPLDYQRRWRAILSLNKSFNYPFASNSPEVFQNHCGKSRSKLLKVVGNSAGMEGNNTEETPADLTYTDLARFPSSFKKRLLLSIKIMELMQSTGELDEKGVNFSAIGQDLFNTSTWAVWKRVRKDLPDSLLTKPYALQEQLTFLLTVHNSTVLLQSKEEELVSSDTEAERRELYRNRQSVMKLRRELSSPRTSQSSDEGQSSDSEEENIGSNSNELLQSAIANASERNNLVYRRRWKRKLAYFTDLYNRGDFKASEKSITLDPADLKGSSVAAAVMSTLKSPLPAASKHKQSKRNQPSLASSFRASMVKSSETIASQKLTSGSSKAGAKVAASVKAIMKELNSSSDDGESSSEADEVADESSQNDDNSSDDSAVNIAKMPNKSSSASNKSAGAMIFAASAAISQISHPQKSTKLSNAQKSFESSETNSDSSSDDSMSSEQVAPAKKVLSSPTQSASGKSISKILAAVSEKKRSLAVVDSSSDTFSDTESGSESDASSSSSDENAHPTRPRPQTTVPTVPQKKPSAKPASGDSSMKTSGTSASKSMGPPNKKNSSSTSSPALDPGTSVKINDHKTIPSKDSKRKSTQTLPDHHNKKVKR